MCWLSWSAAASPRSDVLHPLQMQVRPGDSLKILGVHGRLKLVRDARFKNLQIEVVQHQSRLSADWNLSLERRGTKLEIEVFSIANPTQWRSQLSNNEWPEYDIFIRGPTLPVTVSWRQGTIEVDGWDQKVDVSLLEGALNVRNSKGFVAAQGGRLSLVAEGHNGDLRFHADRGQLRVQRSRGSFQAHLMEGALTVSDFEGSLEWSAERASFFGARGRGSWNLRAHAGSVELEQFEGTLKGVGETVKWRISASQRAEVDVRSSSGPVKVRWSRGAAKAFLSSHSGAIQAPAFAAVQRESGRSRWLAQWGDGPLGQIFVKTQSGSISLMK